MNKKSISKVITVVLSLCAITASFAVVAHKFYNFPQANFPRINSYGTPSGNNQKQIEKIQQNQSDKFSFAVLSDSHVNPVDGGNSKTLKSILKDIDKGNYAFAIDVGDLVAGDGKNGQFFYDIIKGSKIPVLTAVGNHDIESDGGKNYLSVFGDFYYSFSYGNSLFIVAGDASESMVTAQQASWLEAQLQRNYRHKFVFMHIPFYDPRPSINHALGAFPSGDLKAKLASALMEKYKPDIVFFGHIHAYYDWTRNGVEYITTGGSGGGAVGNNPAHDFHNYIDIQVDGDSVVKKVIKIP